MLEIKNITKIYETEGFKQKALNDVSVNFRECEFASILGPSGSGKTTFLNIIGGLDQYTDGDLIINDISTKKFKDSDWDSYRNHRIGFVFQNYNLISHQSVLNNVKLALTLSGISKKEATTRAKKVLKDVGLEHHINKRPSQLSGGQMQRVAIARALINDPDILLADEPTGALDSETSIQIMELLKKISDKKLVIMVTHNPDLANKYSTRIINLKDGKITSDTNPFNGKDEVKVEDTTTKSKKTKMSFKTALGLSFNNLMTKKGRTILVAFAGSIGIIGIALIMAVSTGFQDYIDGIQEDALTSYPLTLIEESTDIAGVLLSLQSGSGENDKSNTVKEKQYLTSMLSNIKANDLKGFYKYYEDNYKTKEEDISNVMFNYSVDPNIYTVDATGKLAKLNPNSMFTSMYGSNSIISSFSSFTSIYAQMTDDYESLEEQYDVLAGRWPEKYNEMIIVLSEPNSISDLLVYSLGLRDYEELEEIITKVMTGESVDINHEPKTFTYEDLMNIELRVIPAGQKYRYNKNYDVYEDMSEDKDYMMNLYNKAEKLKIVGVVSAKPGTTTMALNPGIAYTSGLVKHLINHAKDSEAVNKQINSPLIDVFSGNRFDSKDTNFDFSFADLVSVDSEKMKSAFGVNIDQEQMEKETQGYMLEIMNAVTTNTQPAKDTFDNNLKTLTNGMFSSIKGTVSASDIENVVNSYLDGYEAGNILKEMENNYVVPKDTLKTTYSGLLKGILQGYITAYYGMDQSLTEDPSNPTAVVVPAIKDGVVDASLNSAVIISVSDAMSKAMTEAVMKKTILTKVGDLTTNLTSKFASAFNVDQDKIVSAFSLKFSEDELTRVVSAMMNQSKTTYKSNLISLGYQKLDEPTIISYYFTSFDGKENFLNFIDKYNDDMEKAKKEDKVINYSDTTGILMNSVKTIVNAVTYVLIFFVSISLVVSSIMIGIITYISVYERTKEIGILRAIGASKRNISSIFNAETFIIGLLSGLFGIGISYACIPIINMVLHHYTGNIPLSAMLRITSAITLVILSIILTLIGGLIPARSASKKDPVEALRSE